MNCQRILLPIPAGLALLAFGPGRGRAGNGCDREGVTVAGCIAQIDSGQDSGANQAIADISCGSTYYDIRRYNAW